MRSHSYEHAPTGPGCRLSQRMKSLGPDCPTRSPLGALGSDATTYNGLHRNASSMATAFAASAAVTPATALWKAGRDALKLHGVRLTEIPAPKETVGRSSQRRIRKRPQPANCGRIGCRNACPEADARASVGPRSDRRFKPHRGHWHRPVAGSRCRSDY